MAYNNGFPVTYNQFNQPVPFTGNGMIWTQGENGAKSFMMGPNSTVPLWDSEAQTIYLKTTDNTGRPSIKILDYTVRDQVQPQIQNQEIVEKEYVTKEEYNALKEEIGKLKNRLDKDNSYNKKDRKDGRNE